MSEAVLPAFDGEIGVLADHGDYIGLLGTGSLKIVRDGNDYWFVISSGVYEVNAGKLTVITELGEEASEVDTEAASARLKDSEAALDAVKDATSKEHQALKLKVDRDKARLEVHHRTESVH